MKEYVGCHHELFACLHQQEQQERERRRLEARRRRLEREEWENWNRGLRHWLDEVNRVAGLVLAKAGWHLVRRQWRRAKGVIVDGKLLTTPVLGVEPTSWVHGDLVAKAGLLEQDLIAKADAGDRLALKELDRYFDRPEAAALWGDMTRITLEAWAKAYGQKNTHLRRGVIRHLINLRSQLSGPDPNALELFLVERVCLCWFVAYWSDFQYASLVWELQAPIAKFHLQRIEMAHRNLLSAVKALARIRRQKLPEVLAVVNVAAPGLSSPPATLPPSESNSEPVS